MNKNDFVKYAIAFFGPFLATGAALLNATPAPAVGLGFWFSVLSAGVGGLVAIGVNGAIKNSRS